MRGTTAFGLFLAIVFVGDLVTGFPSEGNDAIRLGFLVVLSLCVFMLVLLMLESWLWKRVARGTKSD